MAVSGAALACCVKIDDWDTPSADTQVDRFVLDASGPSVLSVPPGYANGAMSLTPGTKLLYLSDASLDASLGDDIRYPARYWDPWQVAERLNSIETSVIIPTLDDVATIATTLENLNTALAAAGAPAEVLIVDAGSRDGTLELAADLADKYPLLHTRLLVQDRSQSGFGSVLRLGIAYAEGRYCVILMPDARDPLELIPKMLSELRSGAHLVLCSRFDGAEVTADIPRRFVIYQALYQKAIKLLLGVDIPDSTYGFRHSIARSSRRSGSVGGDCPPVRR